jgi:hypothetical protein
MTLKEYAELNNITLADAKKRTGLSHWKQEVVADALKPKESFSQHDSNGVSDISYHSNGGITLPSKKEVVEVALEVADLPISEEAEEVVAEVVVEVLEIVEEAVAEVAEVIVEAVSDEYKRRSVKGLGTKSPYWSELRG